MELLSYQELDRAAGQRLAQAAYDPRRLSLLHSAAAGGAMALLAIISFLLSKGIGNTAGLAGIGTRTALESVQYILQLTLTLALPFWEAGFVRCAMGIARGEEVTPSNFTDGFRRIGPLLRLWLLQGLILFAVLFVAIQLSSILISFTPFAQPMLEFMEQLLADPTLLEAGTLPQPLQDQLAQAMLPVYALAGILTLALGIPLFYRFRMAQYAVLDQDRPGALAALARSRSIMRGNALALFKLDLRLWWYYLLRLLCAVVAYLDVLLPLMGLALPLGTDGSYFLAYGLHLLATLGLAWYFRSRISVLYACAYDRLLPQQ